MAANGSVHMMKRGNLNHDTDTSEPVLICNVMPLLAPMDRTPGVHVSTCIRRMAIRLNHLTPAIEMDTGRMELGSAWEEGLKRRFYSTREKDFVDVGEIEFDGIFGTPDLLDIFIPHHWQVKGSDKIAMEIKCSWISSAHNPLSTPYWKFWAQLMSYCYMLNTRLGKLIVCHVKGHYKDDSPVQYREWMREFTEYELLSNWSWILKEAQLMDREAQGRGFDSVQHEMEEQRKNGRKK